MFPTTDIQLLLPTGQQGGRWSIRLARMIEEKPPPVNGVSATFPNDRILKSKTGLPACNSVSVIWASYLGFVSSFGSRASDFCSCRAIECLDSCQSAVSDGVDVGYVTGAGGVLAGLALLTQGLFAAAAGGGDVGAGPARFSS